MVEIRWFMAVERCLGDWIVGEGYTNVISFQLQILQRQDCPRDKSARFALSLKGWVLVDIPGRFLADMI